MNLKEDLMYSAIITLVITGLFYLLFLNHVDINEVGVAYNSLNGQITLQTNAGWYITSPAVKVVNVNCWPTKVSLNTGSSANVIGTKIVRIRKDKVMDYINFQGLQYSWGNFQQILTAYTFCGTQYNFIEVIQE